MFGMRCRQRILFATYTPTVLHPHSAMETDAAGATGGGSHDALQVLYGPGDVQSRFGGLKGRLLQDKIFECYNARPQTLPFFMSTSDGKSKRNLVRHERNQREHGLVQRKYEQMILEHGLVQGVRGQAWVQEPSRCNEPYKLMTFGTVAEALYEMAEKFPDNPQVISSLQAGLPCIVFDARMPTDVVEELRDTHNNFHHGAGISILQYFDFVQEIEAKWTIHRKDNNITSNQHDYESKYKTWVINEYGPASSSKVKMKTWLHYDNYKSTLNRLKKLGIKDRVFKYCSKCMDFLDPASEPSLLITILHHIHVFIGSNFEMSLGQDEVALITFEAFKFALPSSMEVVNQHSEFGRPAPLLMTTKGVDREKLELLNTGMLDSAVYKKGTAKKPGIPEKMSLGPRQ